MSDESLRPLSGRRDFVANAVMMLAGFLGLGGLATRFLQFLYPVVVPEQLVEVPAASLDAIPQNGGVVMNLSSGQHLALVDAGGEVRAFSAVCTHLGCIVTWEPTMDHLYCACHGGMFDREGKVVGGPPPRPLERFDAEVRDGRVYVKVRVRPRAPGATVA